jgi:hypothetical protein
VAAARHRVLSADIRRAFTTAYVVADGTVAEVHVPAAERGRILTARGSHLFVATCRTRRLARGLFLRADRLTSG